jgi:hypothetical protein
VPFPKITAVVVLVCPLDSVMAHWSVLLPEGVQTTEVTVTPGGGGPGGAYPGMPYPG